MNCIFCKIVHEDPFKQVLKEYKYEDRHVAVFEPLNPCHPGHRLFVHSIHSDKLCTMDDETERNIIGDINSSIGQYSKEHNIDDYNVIINRGGNADQTVFHLHVHFIPRSFPKEVEMPWSHQQK